jgi:hypothetical protein
MAKKRVLLPYNFTPYDERALDFVINTFADEKDIQITLFHAYTPLPEVDADEIPEMRKMARGMSFLSQELSKKEDGLKSAKEFLTENGFSNDQVDYIFKKKVKSIADEIIETATKDRHNILVFSRQSGKVTRFFARSVHNRVLSILKDVTVCIAT